MLALASVAVLECTIECMFVIEVEILTGTRSDDERRTHVDIDIHIFMGRVFMIPTCCEWRL